MPTTGEIESAANLPWYCCFILLAALITLFAIAYISEGENVTGWTIGLIVTWSTCLFLTIYFGLRAKDKRSYSDGGSSVNVCPDCSGSGVCQRCDGLGKIWKAGGGLLVCPVCNGTGNCPRGCINLSEQLRRIYDRSIKKDEK